MKTVLIWNEFELQLKFVVLDGDYTRFDGVYINGYTEDKKIEILQNELYRIAYSPDGNALLKFDDVFPTNAVSRDHAKVIVCGFIP